MLMTMRTALMILLSSFMAIERAGSQSAPAAYQTSMVTVPFFSKPYNVSNPPTCNTTLLNDFSSGVWNWIHGLIEFAIRDNDFSLDQFTMSDKPYARYLEMIETAENAKDDEERRELVSTALNSCKTCQYLGCYAWCSPKFCRLCSNDDDNRRRFLRSPSASASSAEYEQDQRQLQVMNQTDYNLLALKISDIVTTEGRNYLLAYNAAQYACMGVATGLQIIVRFIPYT